MDQNDLAQQSFIVDPNVLDLDEPNFNPTKYNKTQWKVFHSLCFILFSFNYLLSFIANLAINESLNQRKKHVIFDLDFDKFRKVTILLGGIFYFMSSWMEWAHFRRGCIGYSNLNSKTKTNRDMSLKANFIRAKTGIMYFFCVIASVLMIVIAAIELNYDVDEVSKYNKTTLYIHIACFVLLSLSGVMRLDRVTEITKQYNYNRDRSYFISELLIFVGSLLILMGMFYDLATIDYKENDYHSNLKNSFYLYHFLYVCGSGSLFISSFFMLYRYFCSGFQDLNLTVHSESEISF